MSFSNQFNQVNKTSSTFQPQMNIAIRVSGYSIGQGDPSEDRVFGQRIDNSEYVEAYVNQIDNPNQPQIKSLSGLVKPGGTVMLGSAYIDTNKPKVDPQSACVFTTRWPKTLTIDSVNGKTFIANARVGTPFFHNDGRVSMSVDILRKAQQVRTMEELNNMFFHCLNPTNSALGSLPYAAIRLTDCDPQGNPLTSAIIAFRPAFATEGYGPADVQSSYSLYTTPGTKEYDTFTNAMRVAENALKDPSVIVEVAPIQKFSVGQKTKQTIVNKLNKGQPISTWEVAPTLLDDDSSYTGYSKYTVTLRPAQDGGFICTTALPKTSNQMITKSGLETLEDKERFAQQGQSAANQSQPSQPAQPHQQQAQSYQAPARQPVQPQQQHTQSYQAPERQPVQSYQQPTQSYQAPERQPDQPHQQQTQSYQHPAHEFQQPQNNQQGQFQLNNAGEGYFAIIPPKISQDVENVMLQNLNKIAASRNQNGMWIFPSERYNDVSAALDFYTKLQAAADNRYSNTIDYQMTQQEPGSASQAQPRSSQQSSSYAQQPQSSHPGQFQINNAGDGFFAIIPPKISQEMENSIFSNLSMMAQSRNQQGMWIFSMNDYNHISELLESSIGVLSNSDNRYQNSIYNQLNNPHQVSAPHSSQQSRATSDAPIDLGQLGNEIDTLFADPNSSMGGMNQ